MPEPYVREPTDFIPDSEDTSAAASREVTQANISQNNDTKAQQRPKVVSLVCRAHEGQLSAAPYSIKPSQLVSLKYSKTCLKWPLKHRQKKILMTIGSLMKVESIAECSPWSILQYM